MVMSDRQWRRKLRRLKPGTQVIVSASVYDDDYRLHGDAVVAGTTEDGMVKVRFTIETYVSLERVEMKP